MRRSAWCWRRMTSWKTSTSSFSCQITTVQMVNCLYWWGVRKSQLKIFFQRHSNYIAGFGSYVGEVIQVHAEEELVELKYRYCCSGHRIFFRNTFTPRMFHYIARIKYSKYRELQKGHMHPDFDPNCREDHEVRNKFNFMTVKEWWWWGERGYFR